MAQLRLVERFFFSNLSRRVVSVFDIQKKILWFWWTVETEYGRAEAEKLFDQLCEWGTFVKPPVPPNKVLKENCE